MHVENLRAADTRRRPRPRRPQTPAGRPNSLVVKAKVASQQAANPERGDRKEECAPRLENNAHDSRDHNHSISVHRVQLLSGGDARVPSPASAFVSIHCCPPPLKVSIRSTRPLSTRLTKRARTAVHRRRRGIEYLVFDRAMNPFDDPFCAVEPPSIEGLTVLLDRRFLGFGQHGDFGADRIAGGEVAIMSTLSPRDRRMERLVVRMGTVPSQGRLHARSTWESSVTLCFSPILEHRREFNHEMDWNQ